MGLDFALYIDGRLKGYMSSLDVALQRADQLNDKAAPRAVRVTQGLPEKVIYEQVESPEVKRVLAPASCPGCPWALDPRLQEAAQEVERVMLNADMRRQEEEKESSRE